MQIDHTNYPKRLKGLDSEALRFIIKDCREAINALPDNPKNGYYADEINYCVMELHRRKNKVNWRAFTRRNHRKVVLTKPQSYETIWQD